MRRDLVEAASRGDHEAFEVLATSAGDRLYAVARLIVRSADLAEDAVQEALVRAWQQLPSLRDPDRFDAWLYRLVVNACADQGRQASALVAAGPTAPARCRDQRRDRFRRRSGTAGAGLRSTEARAAGGDRPPLLQRVHGGRDRQHPRYPRGDRQITIALRDRGDASGARGRCATAGGRQEQDRVMTTDETLRRIDHQLAGGETAPSTAPRARARRHLRADAQEQTSRSSWRALLGRIAHQSISQPHSAVPRPSWSWPPWRLDLARNQPDNADGPGRPDGIFADVGGWIALRRRPGDLGRGPDSTRRS